MSLSIVEKQSILEFATDNNDELAAFMGPNAEEAHKEDGFLEIALVATLFMSFVISLGGLSKAVMNIHDLLKRAMGLVKWWRTRGQESAPEIAEPTLREKLLVILFEAYASNNKGLTSERLLYFCGGTQADLETGLGEMLAQGVVRKTRQGSWKYVRQ